MTDDAMHDSYGRPLAELQLEQSAFRLRRQLAERLFHGGQITDPEWRRAFGWVPRHDFAPAFWAPDATGELQRVERGEPGWLETVYSDQALITQMTDGIATSSSTGPGLMAVMLEALSVRDGNRVKEIATGTGYNAALLSERLGADRVTTVEVDPELAALADRRLHQAGYAPRVVIGDGRQPQGGRTGYDRTIVTCGMDSIPYALVEETRPGGIIVSPLGGGIVRLVVDHDGTAEGRFLPQPSYFMAARQPGQTGMAPHPGRPADPRHSTSRVAAVEWASNEMLHFLASLFAPGMSWSTEHEPETGAVRATELWAADGSWARVDGVDVQQSGPRHLWDAVEAACDGWEAADTPGRDAFGVTVDKDGQRLWIEDGNNPFPAGGAR
ncbi:protein-L-isoaspartate(D-aspartate) O-methyltransferase [Streptomyces sp. DSM 42041]|uniref:Protein-L-isoaspartate O-methyltransferase n=1 Tax=Streptomyces hazeniae TaxID=3075538 RepID=A0ABU2NN48_9ACTN|nr:protein-L-isoaspartate(D-aspartate) O-methyltransferase [Streptomyces sp. DSM 42041]MDT0378405.1 protein-L-isoaspartate(D-aspartate) O-methyltransferase [Streptomyces sp. DSM 42041]